ncbi:MAG: Ornithine carbamoyltransferase [Planctomycetota bacterium]|jgi:ornithine carbamoyltransferase
MRHLTTLFDISPSELCEILRLAHALKKLWREEKRPALLAGRVLALLFEKPSLRTRVSFEAGMTQLGGAAMFLGQDVGWQKREKTSDFIQVLGQYADFIVCRAKAHTTVDELASYNAVSVINGLTDLSHPCQAIADLMTMEEICGNVKGKQLTFVGDGNNVARSLALICAMSGMRFKLLGPEAHYLDTPWLNRIRERYPQADIEQTHDAKIAMKNADFVYTDVWVSMGQEEETQERLRTFRNYQLNRALMDLAAKHAKVLHCLPAHRGEEIAEEVIDGPQSAIVQQAGNRMHGQKGLLVWLAIQSGWVEPNAI